MVYREKAEKFYSPLIIVLRTFMCRIYSMSKWCFCLPLQLLFCTQWTLAYLKAVQCLQLIDIGIITAVRIISGSFWYPSWWTEVNKIRGLCVCSGFSLCYERCMGKVTLAAALNFFGTLVYKQENFWLVTWKLMKVIYLCHNCWKKFESQMFIVYNMDCVHVDDLLMSRFSVERDVIKCAIKISCYMHWMYTFCEICVILHSDDFMAMLIKFS